MTSRAPRVSLFRESRHQLAVRLQPRRGHGEKGVAAALIYLRHPGGLLRPVQPREHRLEGRQIALFVVPLRQSLLGFSAGIFPLVYQRTGHGEVRAPGLLPQPRQHLRQGRHGLFVLYDPLGGVREADLQFPAVRQGDGGGGPLLRRQVPPDAEDVGRFIVALHGIPVSRPGLYCGQSGIYPRRRTGHPQHDSQQRRKDRRKPARLLKFHDRLQPFLQMFALRPQRGGGMDRLIPASGGDGPQNGVPVGPTSRPVQAAQYRLVAGQFPRPFHLPGHPVYQRIEPVDADCQLHEPLIQHVPPAVVGQLMEDHETEILLRQLNHWQYHTGLPYTQQHG